MKRVFFLLVLALVLSGCSHTANNQENLGGVQLSPEPVKNWEYRQKSNEVKKMLAQTKEVSGKKGMVVYFFNEDVTCEQLKNIVKGTPKYEKPMGEVFFQEMNNKPYNVRFSDSSFADAGDRAISESSDVLYEGILNKTGEQEVNGNVKINRDNFKINGEFKAQICQ